MVSEAGLPLERKYFRAGTEQELARGDVARGYEVKKGEFVIVEEDELERLAPERARDIDLSVFVKQEDIDPIYFERAYYLAPARESGSTKAYKLLARVMEDAGRAGIATFVMRDKEYLAAILSERGILRLETLRFADEIRSPDDVGLPKPARVSAADVKRMEKAVERLAKSTLDPDELVDHEAERLEALAKKKAREGEDVVKVELDPGDDDAPVDLMERLRESLAGNSKARGTRKTGRKSARKAKTTRKRKRRARA